LDRAAGRKRPCVPSSEPSVDIFDEDGNDTLTGGIVTDRVDGGGGNDILNGRAGLDILEGRRASIHSPAQTAATIS
jgi:RTX calcium-binding nonapeptide repeat (4 copies)